jgi:Pectin methylesterase
MLLVAATAFADGTFTGFKADLMNGNLLTADEIAGKTTVTMGLAVAPDGTVSRVATDASDAVATIGGKYHSNDHGWQNFSATVPVTGPVKITFGTCAWGGDVTVKNAAGTTVATFSTNTGACYHQNTSANVISGYYKGSEATTLTITGGNYVPYFAVEPADPSELATDVTIAYSLGSVAALGTAPASATVAAGSSYTLPQNRTLFVAGKTLTAWTDGTESYQPGQTITAPQSNVTLTPVFTDNTVSLADATEETTLFFDFQRKNGAPLMAYQNTEGIYVTQATVGTSTIDVKLDFNTSPGKIANGNWTDWCQMNAGTTLTVPSAAGAVVSMEAYSNITTTTIDGQKDYTPATVVSYTVASKADSVDIVIGDGSYYRYVKVVLPIPTPAFQAKTYDNEPATVEWPFTGNTTDPAAVTPEGIVALTAFAHGTDITEATSAAWDGISYTRFQPVSGAAAASDDVRLEWTVKPTKGLTFTATKVSANVRRFGTDGGLFDVKVVNGEGVEETLATGLIPARNKAAADDKTSTDPNYRTSFSIDVPATITTTSSMKLVVYLYGMGNTKQFGINDVKIEGTVSGTTQATETYAFTATASPAEGGSVNIYPAGESFEAGTELTLTANKNFGYKFVSWTDDKGSVVSTDQKFSYTVQAAANLTANFQKVNTYALTCNIEGGANSYMVQPSVAPTVVDGKNMYEEGTKVTLTAASNDILTFTNWSDGQTTAEITIDMTQDQTITANYTAVDFIAAWDFYNPGNNGRKADFFAADNDADQLVLRDADGNTVGWLDKSNANGGYEGRNAGVNWRNDKAIGYYYWQTKVNASAFTDIKVKSGMAYNYNAYQTYQVDYSTDGTNWTKVGAIQMPGVKAWTDSLFALPADANNQPELYIRWMADKTSAIDGTASANDGIAISQIYITGTSKLVDDGTAPKLTETVPAAGATNASANGKVVLTFDERVQLADGATATLGSQQLKGVAAGKIVTFEYKGLDYATAYTFTLPANSVSDLTGNAVAEPITLAFITMTKPVVAKKLYDFIIPDDGGLREAVAAAANRADKSSRFRIFVKKGSYKVPVTEAATVTGSDGVAYNSVTTVLSASDVSIIGEDMSATVIENDVPYALVNGQWGPASPIEGIGKCDLLQITGTNTYLEDITLKNGTDDATGRNLAVQDKGNKTIYKNVMLGGYQDTWTSNNQSARYYFEDGIIRGRTDYICGKGDAFFNGVTFLNVGTGGYIAVPSQPKQYGWVFANCTIKGETGDNDGNYTLGRPWGSGTPVALWINTHMESQPSAIGWSEMSGGWPARFAEYNSTTATGTVIDLSSRKTTFADTHTNNPVLTAEEAATYTIATVMGSTDDWNPTALTEQASAPVNVKITGSTLTWDDNDYVLLWAVVKDGKVVDFTTTPSYDVTDTKAKWAVRAANEMGGLGEATEATVSTGIDEAMGQDAAIVSTAWYTTDGRLVKMPQRGVNIKVSKYADGSVKTEKVILPNP